MTDIAGVFALVAAAQFAGAAIYVSAVEHPARMRLDARAALTEWQPSYKRGAALQAPLALIGSLLGFWAWWRTGASPWLAGGLILIAAWPWTLIVIRPTNSALLAMRPEEARTETKSLMERWGRLHAVRTALGCAATAAFAWGALV